MANRTGTNSGETLNGTIEIDRLTQTNQSPLSDEELIRAICGGDRHAMKLLYVRHRSGSTVLLCALSQMRV